MIVGIGVDSVEIKRMGRSLANKRFAERVFSPEERQLIESHGGVRRLETAAGCFAAKEAFLKAMGTGIGGFELAEISALRKPSGAPYYKFEGVTGQHCEKEGLCAHLSITHEGGIATAFALLEKP